MPRKSLVWAGRVISGLAALVFAFSAVMKFMGGPQLAEGMAHLQLSMHLARPIGALELLCVVVYLVPQTAVLGAVLLTGYLGGAIATHVRVGNPLFSHTLFPVYVALVVWGGLFLRESRLRALLPWRDRD